MVGHQLWSTSLQQLKEWEITQRTPPTPTSQRTPRQALQNSPESHLCDFPLFELLKRGGPQLMANKFDTSRDLIVANPMEGHVIAPRRQAQVFGQQWKRSFHSHIYCDGGVVLSGFKCFVSTCSLDPQGLDCSFLFLTLNL